MKKPILRENWAARYTLLKKSGKVSDKKVGDLMVEMIHEIDLWKRKVAELEVKLIEIATDPVVAFVIDSRQKIKDLEQKIEDLEQKTERLDNKIDNVDAYREYDNSYH